MPMQVLINHDCKRCESNVEAIGRTPVDEVGPVTEYLLPGFSESDEDDFVLIVEANKHNEPYYVTLARACGPDECFEDHDGALVSTDECAFDALQTWWDRGDGIDHEWWAGDPRVSINDETGWWEITVIIDLRPFVFAVIQDVPLRD